MTALSVTCIPTIPLPNGKVRPVQPSDAILPGTELHLYVQLAAPDGIEGDPDAGTYVRVDPQGTWMIFAQERHSLPAGGQHIYGPVVWSPDLGHVGVNELRGWHGGNGFVPDPGDEIAEGTIAIINVVAPLAGDADRDGDVDVDDLTNVLGNWGATQ